MSRLAVIFLLFCAPVLAFFLAFLGIATLPANLLGWFLLMTGSVYVIGIAAVLIFQRKRLLESSTAQSTFAGEHGDRSFWVISLAMIVLFFLPPVEFIWLPAVIPRTSVFEITGVCLVLVGAGLFIWARRTLGSSFSGHIAIKPGQRLMQNGPYRFIRHPAYAGYSLIALGISLGYSSLIGIVAFFFLLIPSTLYRINKEEVILAAHFGDVFHKYARQTARLIPGIW